MFAIIAAILFALALIIELFTITTNNVFNATTLTTAGLLCVAETVVVPKVVEDMMPYIVNTLVPRVLDGVMPQVREKVLPVIIDDLSRDPKVRKMITDQTQSVINEAAAELRESSEGADDRLESAFRKIMRQ